jgi:hypothetical protein
VLHLIPCVDTLITALPERWDPRGGKTLLEQILGSMDHSSIQSIQTPKDLIRVISLATIMSLEEPYKAALDESCFSIFEKSIASIVNLLRLSNFQPDANLPRHTRRPRAIRHLQNL